MNSPKTILIALALMLPLAGARAVTFTSNATIGPGNMDYASQPIS